MNKRKYPDPNDIVESWKDAIYKETKTLSGKELDRYFKDKADAVLKSYRLNLKKSKLRKCADILVSR